MSRHEGVSCDSCMKANFRGRRYKCLICYDYDLCSTCYEAGATTTRHTVDHPMQCIITRSDFDLYYGGEAVSADHPQSFVCPYCGKMGFTDTALQEHVTAEHPDSSTEVVCPICAALPGGDPNHVTDDFAAHLSLEHRAPRDFEEPMGIRHVRRIPHARGSGARTRRSNMQFHSTASGGGGGTLAGLTPATRESTDPIAGGSFIELLSQLSSVRSRAAAAQNVSSQLQQLEMQLQSTSRQQLERLPRRPAESGKLSTNQTSVGGHQTTLMDYASAVISTGGAAIAASKKEADSQFLLSKVGDTDLSESERQLVEVDRADRSIYVQELLLSSLAECLRLSDDDDTSSNHSAASERAEETGGDGTDNGNVSGDESNPCTPEDAATDTCVRKKSCDTSTSSEPGGSRTQAPPSGSGGGSSLLASALAVNLRSVAQDEASNRSNSSRNYNASSSPKDRALQKVKAMNSGSSSGATKEEGYSSASNLPLVKHS